MTVTARDASTQTTWGGWFWNDITGDITEIDPHGRSVPQETPVVKDGGVFMTSPEEPQVLAVMPFDPPATVVLMTSIEEPWVLAVMPFDPSSAPSLGSPLLQRDVLSVVITQL